MQVIATRDGVHPGDDPVPSHRFEIADDSTPEDILQKAADRHWLPSFWDWQRNVPVDQATWVIASNEVLAVLAYQWPDLRFMSFLEIRMRGVDLREGVLRLHFSYLARVDPEMVYNILRRVTLHSE